MISRDSRLLSGRKPLVVLLAALVVAALVVLLVTRPWAAEQTDAADVAPPAPGDRVLQTVDLAMGDDGSLSSIGDTVIISRAAGGNADTVSTAYDPTKVVDDLPVRVLTSYRTGDRAGTNLADLKGYTGKVTIDLTVQNLTVAAQKVSYDVAGQSRSATAMVGAPLTVVASAALPGTDPSTVVTDAGSSDQAETNGVLSQSPTRTTQVQWATILAPPQLGSTATLRLVVDAKDFTVPTYDLSVQPGLVTDSSVGALVDAAFNPQSSKELELESRTIKLIGDVNGVLDQAGDTIAKVRKNLDSTSKTLGTQTVSDLQTSTKQIASSMKTSDDNITALGKDLSSSLSATNSATLSSMSETVAKLDQILGDTSGTAPPATVTGSGCEQEVGKPTKGGSIYDELLQVSAQLDGYASATTACKETLQKSILANIGPSDPTEETCGREPADKPSVTCSLSGVESRFVGIAEQFVQDSQTALDALDPGELDPVTTSVDALITKLDAVETSTDTLLTLDPPTTTRTTLAAVATSLGGAGTALTEVSDAVAGIHDQAEAQKANLTSMVAQNKGLADQLCDLVGDPTQPGTLTAEKVEQLRSYLATRSCPDANGDTTALVPPDGYGTPSASMEARLDEMGSTLDAVANQTDVADAGAGLGLSIARLRAKLVDATEKAADLGDALDADDAARATKVAALRDSVVSARQDLVDLKTGVSGAQGSYAEVKATLLAALKTASDKAEADAKEAVDPQISRIADQSQADSDQIGEMFERSAAGLSAAADAVRDDGAGAVQKQHDALKSTQDEAAKSLTDTTKGALQQVTSNVSSATRDLSATRALLARDLSNVLLDLGSARGRGTGVVGQLSTSATAARTADYQLSLATDKSSAYASVRSTDVAGIRLRQAQAEASLQREADLPAFAMALPATVQHRTVYVFHLGR